MVSCDFAILFSAKRHKVKKIKRLAGTEWGNTKKINLDGLLRFCDLVFCQTAHSKENKKTSRHTMRKYKDNDFGWFCDLVFCQAAQSEENKKTSRHTMRKYKENDFGWFCDLVFCQTAQSEENKKTSRHTMRKYIEYYFKVTRRHTIRPEIHKNIFEGHSHVGRRCDSERLVHAFGMPNGTK